MFSYQRLQDIFQHIHSQKNPVPLQALVAIFHISERTLRTDITNINLDLRSHGAFIDRIRKKGYFISIQDTMRFASFLDQIQEHTHSDDLDNAQKRIHYVLQLLLFENDYITQDNLADRMFVSRNTILNYMKTIKDILHTYQLTLDSKTNLGIKIVGSEQQKRICFMEVLIPHDEHSCMAGFTKEEERIFEGINLYAMEHIILEYANAYNVTFSDFNLRNLILHFALIISRIQHGCPYIEKHSSFDREFDLLPLTKRIEDYFQLLIPQAEMHYIYSHFMSNAKTMFKYEENANYIQQLIQHLLENIYKNYNFDLRNDLLLKEDLMHHFQSILNTKRYHMNKRNPLLNTIKTNYPLAYDITFTSVHELLEKEEFQLTDDEIGYVSLHIGAAIKRCFSAQIQKKSVIIVCGSGYATSRMLEAKLNTIFKDKLTIVGRYSYHEYQQMQLDGMDFIISTIPIEQKDVPVVTVDFSLFNHDIEHITKMIARSEVREQNKLDVFFDQNLFLYVEKRMDKESLLHTLCELLQQHNHIDDRFEASVLKRESIAATNMDEVLAIPHPMESFATKTKVAVALLPQPLAWNGKSSVRIVLLLAIGKDDQKNIEYLYDTFIQIMNQPQMQNLLLHCKDFKQFMNILYQYSQDAISDS